MRNTHIALYNFTAGNYTISENYTKTAKKLKTERTGGNRELYFFFFVGISSRFRLLFVQYSVENERKPDH